MVRRKDGEGITGKRAVHDGEGFISRGTSKSKPAPVIISAPSPEFLAGWARKNYGLSRNTRCFFWFHGLNLVYHIHDGPKKYALKIYRPWWRTAEQVDYELKECIFLRKSGIPICVPLPTQKEAYFSPLNLPDEVATAVLFTFAEGENRQDPMVPLARKVGRLLARLHQAQDRFFAVPPSPPMEPELLTSEQVKKLEPYRSSFGRDWPLLKKASVRLKRELARLPRRGPAYGLIHGDVHYGNMRYDLSKRNFVLFDLELTVIGWRLYDVATFLWDLWDDSPAFSRAEKRQGTKAFIRSYSDLRPMSPVEIKAIPTMMAARQLHWMGAQADYAPRLSGILVSPERHRQKMKFLKSWMSGELTKMVLGR